MMFHVLTPWSLGHVKRLRYAIFKSTNFMKPWRIWTNRISLVGIVILVMIMVVLVMITVVVVVIIIIVVVIIVMVITIVVVNVVVITVVSKVMIVVIIVIVSQVMIIVRRHVATKMRDKLVGLVYLVMVWAHGWTIEVSRSVWNGVIVFMVLHCNCAVKLHWIGQRVLFRMWNKLIWRFALQYLCLLS